MQVDYEKGKEIFFCKIATMVGMHRHDGEARKAGMMMPSGQRKVRLGVWCG
jgi:hypothetical protein